MFFLLPMSISMYAQQSYCPNANLSQGNFTNWSAFYGVNTGSSGIGSIVTPNQGVNSQHTIMTAGNYDPNLLPCLNFPVVPPGFTHSAMVGDYGGGVSQAAKLTYDFFITPQSNLITFLFSLVGKYGGESVSNTPGVQVSVWDDMGNPLPGSFYQELLSVGNPGWQNCGVSIKYRDWQQIGLDVSAYMGQTLTLEIAVTDCQLHLNNNIHFMYGYVVATCGTLNTYIPYCPNGVNDSTTLVAPSGYSNYIWRIHDTGMQVGTGQSFVIDSIANFTSTYGDTLDCEMTNGNGSIVTVYTIFVDNAVQASFVDSNVCEGDLTYLANNSNYQNFQPALTSWSASDGYTSNAYNFSHIFPSDGNYNVQLITSNTLGCVDTVSTNVVVYQNPVYSFLNQTALDTFLLNGQTYTQTGNYTQAVYTVNGCDSVIVLNLTVNHTGLFQENGEPLMLYPNPVDQHLYVQGIEDYIGKEYAIYNYTGSLVVEGIIKGSENMIPMDKFDRGIYFFKIKDLESNPILFTKL
jgi:hypothetical protein